MINDALENLDRSARSFSPFLTSFILIMISALPLYMPGYGQIVIEVGLVSVFYWSIYRPDLFPSIAALALGLWQDILVGSPLGLHALVLLLANWAIMSQRNFFQGKSFIVVWWCFSVVALVAALLSWFVVCLLNFAFINPLAVLFQAILTIGAFPFMVWFLARLQKAVLHPIGTDV